MTSQLHPDDPHFSSRRRLLKGALAVVGGGAGLGGCGGSDAAGPAGDGGSGGGTPPPTTTPPAPAPPGVPTLAPRPAWAGDVPANSWHTLQNTAFLPWATANIPQGAYRGTSALTAIVNAYSDPAHDPTAGAQVFYGGGHGDGTCNAVCSFSHQTLRWQLIGKPTDPAVYLPDYLRTSEPVYYPSGRYFTGGSTTKGFPLPGEGGWFLPAADLPAQVDAPYRAPALARVSTHMYAAAAMRGKVVHYFYDTYAEFDTASGTWSGQGIDLGQQLLGFRRQYGAPRLQQGTVAIYDEVTDRFFVTLNPGDNGGSWRSGIIAFDPVSRRIEAVHETSAATYGQILNSVNICRVDRDLYVFTKQGSYAQPQLMNQGFVFNMDTRSFRSFVLTGDTEGSTFPFSSTQETIPSWYDGQAIRRWNHAASLRDRISSVALAPLRGSGTPNDPLVLQQTARTIAWPKGVDPLFVYKRLVYHAGAGCALLLPQASSNWLALRLS
jgi:hypothetical protein